VNAGQSTSASKPSSRESFADKAFEIAGRGGSLPGIIGLTSLGSERCRVAHA